MMTVRSGGNALNTGCLWLGLNLMFVVFLVIGGWYGFNSWRLATSGGQVSGEVVEMEASTSDGSTTYAPVVEYVVAGETYTFHGGSSSNPPAYHVGQEVDMLYALDDPGTAKINNFWELWLIPLIFLPIAALGGLLFNVIMLAMVVARRRGPAPIMI